MTSSSQLGPLRQGKHSRGMSEINNRVSANLGCFRAGAVVQVELQTLIPMPARSSLCPRQASGPGAAQVEPSLSMQKLKLMIDALRTLTLCQPGIRHDRVSISVWSRRWSPRCPRRSSSRRSTRSSACTATTRTRCSARRASCTRSRASTRPPVHAAAPSAPCACRCSAQQCPAVHSGWGLVQCGVCGALYPSDLTTCLPRALSQQSEGCQSWSAHKSSGGLQPRRPPLSRCRRSAACRRAARRGQGCVHMRPAWPACARPPYCPSMRPGRLRATAQPYAPPRARQAACRRWRPSPCSGACTARCPTRPRTAR